jgi:CHAT domain-containing protein
VGELIPELKQYLDTVEEPTLSDLQLKLSYCQAIAELGQPDEALRLLEDLSEELEERQAKVLLIDTLTTMAGIYDSFQLDQHSSDYYQKALGLAQESQNQEKILSLKVALFRVSLRQPYYLKNSQEFLHDFQELLELTKKSGDAGEMALVLTGYVRQMLDASEFENARSALRQMKQSMGGHSPVLEAFIVFGESSVDRQSDNLAKADEHLQRLQTLSKREQFWRMRRPLLIEALRWRMLLGQDLENDPMVQEYEGLSNEFASPHDLLQDYSFRADLSKYRGRAEDFIHYLEVAEALLWSLRDSSNSSDFRTAYYSDANKIYGGLVSQLVEEGRFTEAFEAAERGRGQALVSLFEKNDTRIAQLASSVQRRKLDQLYARRDELERNLMQSDSGQEKTLSSLKVVVADIDSVLSELALDKSSGSGYVSQQAVKVSALRELLAPQQVMLRYFVTSDTTYLFVLSKDEELKVHTLPGGLSLMEKIRAYREGIQKLAKDIEPLRLELSSLLLGPLTDLDRFPEKIIVPDGPLYLLPFGTLDTPKEKALYESQVTILPSARMYAQLKKEPRSPEPGRFITVIADPTYTIPSLEGESGPEVQRLISEAAKNPPAQLPGTLEEAMMVKDLAQEQYKVELHLGVEANRERLFQLSDSGRLSQSRIVHFATHGFTIPSDPRLSGLILSLVNSEGEPSNGFLRLVDIYRLDLNADLVVLSACQTGLGTIRDGDGLQGLYQGFLMAGSRGVLNTLWSVDDAATTELMRHFYTSLMQGESPKRALSLAQQTMAKSSRWHEPFFWAGFQLVSP